MRITFPFILCLCCVLIFLLAQSGYAAIYKYLDRDGLICFADDLQSIPEQYRATAKIVSGEADQENRTPPQNRQTSEQPAENGGQASSTALERPGVQQDETGFFSKGVLLSSIIVVSAVFAFMILGILEADHKKAVIIARITLLWAVTVYLIFMHAGDVVRLVRTTGGVIEDAKHQSEEKGKKAAKAIKALNELVRETGQASSPESAEGERNK